LSVSLSRRSTATAAAGGQKNRSIAAGADAAQQQAQVRSADNAGSDALTAARRGWT